MSLRCVLLLTACLATGPGLAGDQQADDSLKERISALDAEVFAAFNDRALDRFIGYFPEDLEFYHDKDGLSGYSAMIENSRRLFGLANPLRRRLIAESLVVHPVPGHGAIQIGQHEFCHQRNGVEDCGVFAFTHVWRKDADGWKIARILSYGH